MKYIIYFCIRTGDIHEVSQNQDVIYSYIRELLYHLGPYESR